MARDRRRWRARQRRMDPARLVSPGETGASTNMARRHGWAPRGERLVGAAPHGHGKATTLVAGLRASGVAAPFVLDGPMAGGAFRTHVERVLAPGLSPGDVVVADNLAAHEAAGAREAVRAAGATVLHLPPHSPGLNPIEQFFAKLETPLRKAAARAKDALRDATGGALGAPAREPSAGTTSPAADTGSPEAKPL